jgi:drug/metabolite transporter (DMT)-like permease
LNPLFAKPLYAMGLDVASVLLYRYAIAAVLLLMLIVIKRDFMRLPCRCCVPLLGAGVLFAISSLTLFESYRHMDVGIASTILYITPIFVAIIMAIFFREKLTWRKFAIILVALAGIGLLSIKADSTIQNPVGILCVAMSALSYAIYMVIINKSALHTLPTLTLTLYSIVVGIAVFALRLNFFADAVPLPATVDAWYNAVGLAIFPTIISIVAMTVAIQDIGPMPTSMLEALEPVTAIVVGCLAFGEVLTPLNVIGVIVVIAAVTIFVAGRFIKNKFIH